MHPCTGHGNNCKYYKYKRFFENGVHVERATISHQQVILSCVNLKCLHLHVSCILYRAIFIFKSWKSKNLNLGWKLFRLQHALHIDFVECYFRQYTELFLPVWFFYRVLLYIDIFVKNHIGFLWSLTYR